MRGWGERVVWCGCVIPYSGQGKIEMRGGAAHTWLLHHGSGRPPAALRVVLSSFASIASGMRASTKFSIASGTSFSRCCAVLASVIT